MVWRMKSSHDRFYRLSRSGFVHHLYRKAKGSFKDVGVREILLEKLGRLTSLYVCWHITHTQLGVEMCPQKRYCSPDP